MRTISVIFFIIITHQSFGQSTQVLTKDKFKISCPCKLYTNEVFIEMAKEQGMKYPISAYACAENEESYENGTINNIIIYDLASEYKAIPVSGYTLFESKYLKTYKDNLRQANIIYNELTFSGVNAIEYEFHQNGLPTKAIIFVKNKKSYLLQVTTRGELSSKFNRFKSSFISM